MSTEMNKAIVHRLNTEIWDRKNVDAVDEIMASDFALYQSARPVIQGAESLRKWMS